MLYSRQDKEAYRARDAYKVSCGLTGAKYEMTQRFSRIQNKAKGGYQYRRANCPSRPGAREVTLSLL